MIVYDDQLMFRIADYLQNRYIKIVLNNSIEITGQLGPLIRPVRNISIFALGQMSLKNKIGCNSELPKIRAHGNPPLILINSKISSKDSHIIASKVFIRGNHICIIYNNDSGNDFKNESRRMVQYITQHPGNVVKNNTFVKCQRIGENN